MAQLLQAIGGKGGDMLQGMAAMGQVALGTTQHLQAVKWRKEAEEAFAKNPFQIPSSVNMMLDVVRGVASQRKLPGQEYMEQQLGASTAQGLEAATRVGRSSSDVLGALENLYGRQMEQQQKLALAGAQNWQQNQQLYSNALERYGAYETEKWKYNTLYPYMQRLGGASQLGEAGNVNIGSGLKSAMTTDWNNIFKGKTT